jgi:hypothetical protein
MIDLGIPDGPQRGFLSQELVGIEHLNSICAEKVQVEAMLLGAKSRFFRRDLDVSSEGHAASTI